MKTVAFLMKLKPGVSAEYIKRHDEIWPELIQHLHEMGLSEYRIFLNKQDLQTLFAVQSRMDDYNDSLLRDHPIMKRWWDYMADLMHVESDNSPVSCPLTEIFYLP